MTLGDEVQKLQADLTEAQNNLAHPGTEAERTELVGLEEKLAEMQKQLASIGDVAAAETALRADRESAVEVGRCDRELAALTVPTAPDLSKIDEEIDTLNLRIVAGQGVYEEVRKFDEGWRAYDRWKEQAEIHETRIETLDRLVEFFGPNGVKAQMGGDKLKDFVEAMNGYLSPFEYSVEFTLDPYSFRVFNKFPPTLRTLRQLSKSESLRFGIAFQIALAMATGLRFVVIDEADMLDSETRPALTEILLQSDLDQAIVLSTTEKNPPTELPDGVKFIQLERKAEPLEEKTNGRERNDAPSLPDKSQSPDPAPERASPKTASRRAAPSAKETAAASGEIGPKNQTKNMFLD